MKTNYKTLLLGIASTLCTAATAQVSAYMFAQTSETYTPITSGTVIALATSNAAPGNLAATVWNLPNGTFSFPFVFNGTPYTGCNISVNGYITFGNTAPATNLGTPISSNTAYDGAICAWGRANNGGYNLGTAAPFYTSELRVEELGTAPSRTFVIQYDNWRYSSGTGTTVWLVDFQIRLVETTNVVEIVYGPGVMAGGSLTTSGFNAQVGLRGLTNADFNNRSSFGLFNQSTAGTANNATQVIGVTSGNGIFMPPDGLTYRWSPPCSAAVMVTPSITATSTLLCEGDTLDFGGAGHTPYIDVFYQWQVSSTQGGPYSNVTGTPAGTALATYKPEAATGIFYFVLTSNCPNGTVTVVSNEIAVDVRPKPILTILADPALNTTVTPIETCFGETYTLTASGANTYTWVGGPTTDSYVVQPVANPSYTVIGMSVDGCIASRTIDIQVNPLPAISIVSSPSNAICPGAPVIIGAGGNAVTYTWVAENSNSFLITVNPTVTTTYSVIGTSVDGCTLMAVQPVLVHTVAPLVVSGASPGTLCKGEKLNLSATGAFTYTWTALGTYTVGQTVSLMPESTTSYTVTGLNTNGCATQTTVSQIVSGCVGMKETAGELSSLSIYPNPNNGIFTVELNNGAAKTYELMDLTGKIILSTTTSNATAELNINELANGIYYLRAQSDNAVKVVKIVKH